MECPTCGYAMTDFDTECRRCQNLARANSVWPPPIATRPEPQGQTALENTSGMQSSIPPEVLAFKWNWGAFCLGWIWCYYHNLKRLALAMLALGIGRGVLNASGEAAGHQLGLVCSFCYYGLLIYVAIKGHRLAWQNRMFPGGFSQYLAVERAWKNWGLSLMIIAFVIGTIMAVSVMMLKGG